MGHALPMVYVETSVLEAGLDEVRGAPHDNGVVELIVRRPVEDERELLVEATLDPVVGLVGDLWPTRGSSRMPDGSAHPGMQLTLMNSRAAALIAGERERWPLAGDQLYVDFDLSGDNLPPGTRLAVGTAVVEVSDQPHTGCTKFAARFGRDALRFVNSEAGRALNLRGINTQIVEAGVVRIGDALAKLR
jgi:hypothetical protein